MPRGRKSKPKFTIDSKDTRTVIGLVFIVLSGLALGSLFVTAPLFRFFKDLFGNDFATLLFAFTSLNIALAFFRVKYVFAKGKSLFGQILFLLCFSAFLNSIWGANYKLVANEPVQYGGIIGFNTYRLLADNLLLNTTPFFLMLGMLTAIPFFLAMPILKVIDFLGGAFVKLIDAIKRLFNRGQVEVVQEVVESPELSDSPTTVSQLGGMGKLLRFPVGAKPTMPDDTDNAKEEAAKNSQEIAANARKGGSLNQGNNPKITVKDDSGDSSTGAYINEQLKYPDWELPPVSLLNTFKKQKQSQENIKQNADVIEKTLDSFGIRAKVVDVLIGPSVTQYALDLPLGIKVNKIINLSKDLALALAIPANAIRLETPIPGTSYIGIEVPNEDRETVYLKEAMSELIKQSDSLNLPVSLGKDIHGRMIENDLQKMPHLLVAGATGSGKSILTNGFIISLLMTKTPDQVKFIMIDPKQVELSDYNGIPHLLTPVITDMDKVLNALKWAIAEMESRYTIFRESHVKNVEAYNALMGYAALPYIVFVIDEMADMMMSTNRVETEAGIVRLAQKARATGIHLLLATQRPSVDVITGLIKANIPGRVGMSVTTNIDSRVILDQIGAESLLGKGDMLFKDPAKNKPFRIQGIWVSPEEVQRVVQYIKSQVPEVEYTTKVTEYADKAKETAQGGVQGDSADNSDNKDIIDAIHCIVSSQKASASYLQRRLRYGYNKAARILEELEEMGVVGPSNGSKPRDVYVSDAEAFIGKYFGAADQSAQPEAAEVLEPLVMSENEPDNF